MTWRIKRKQPPPATSPAATIRWDALRRAYLDHFGAPVELFARYQFEDDEWLSGSAALPPRVRRLVKRPSLEAGRGAEPAYFQAHFGELTRARTRVVYATFGASSRTGGHEVFVAAPAPSSILEPVPGDRAVTGRPLEPGAVIPLELRGTPFVALLLAPIGAGSFVVESRDGREHCALSAIPLTRAEAKLAGHSMEQLVRALHRQGVLEAVDVLRDCVVEPETTRGFWAFQRPAVIHRALLRVERAAKHLQRLGRLQAPAAMIEDAQRALAAARAERRFVALRRVDPDASAQRLARRLFGYSERLHRIWALATHDLPMPRDAEQRWLLAELFGVVLTTHPAARVFLLEAEGCAPVVFDEERLIPEVARWIERFHPDADVGALLAAGRTGLSVAARLPEAVEPGPPSWRAWKLALTAMYLRYYDPPSLEEGANNPLLLAAIEGIGAAADVRGWPARERARSLESHLADRARLIVLKMLVVLLDVRLGRDLGDAGGPPWRH